MSRPVDFNGCKLAPPTLQAIIDRVEAGISDKAIRRQTGVVPDLTRKYRRNLETRGQPYAPKCVKLGRPSTLRDIHRQRLCEFLKERPQAYLEEMKD